MNQTIEARNVRGTCDLIKQDAQIFQNILNEARLIADYYNFSPIELPIFEFAEVFERTIGDSSDVVNKELYSFYDRSEHKLALRPEFTASTIRAIHSNKLINDLPLKLFTSGPVFRYDRPQKCRQRQFNQINYEVIGIDNPYIDAEMLMLTMTLLKNLEINNVKLHINSLGTTTIRKNYSEALVNYLEKFKDELSEDSKVRLEKNPLRILDSKNENDQKIILDAPKIAQFYDDETKIFFEKLQNYLTNFKIDFVIDDKLVRGLDYYTHTVFEIITEELGAQGTIIAGGRYHNLSKFFSNKEIPCFGCAAGVERLMALCKKQFAKKQKIGVLSIGENSILTSSSIADKLRKKLLCCDLILGGDLKKLLSRANKESYDFAIFVGDNEIKNNSYTIRNLGDGSQANAAIDEIGLFFS